MAFLLDQMRALGNLSRFVELIEAVDLAGPLNGPGQFTVFSPTDDAFDQAPQDILELHSATYDKQRSLALHHVTFGLYDELTLRQAQRVKNAGGNELKVGDDYAVLRISGALITSSYPDLENGALHLIERVLWPPLR
ncbi:MAG: fasciclin domain-containing protein [Bdellovibrionales bacterium]|nr:fasciclin domain-containing protein [Bdellovibrionales bacterium]